DPVSLRFTKQPTSFRAGSFMTGTVEVAVEDRFGNGVPGPFATLSMGSNPGGDSWASPQGVGAAGDGHTFFFVGGIRKAAQGYTFVASSGTLSVVSVPFDVKPNYPAALKFRSSPTEAVACQPITPPIEVAVTDEYGNETDSIDLILISVEGATTLH